MNPRRAPAPCATPFGGFGVSHAVRFNCQFNYSNHDKANVSMTYRWLLIVTRFFGQPNSQRPLEGCGGLSDL
jgi:hypothetical protein